MPGSLESDRSEAPMQAGDANHELAMGYCLQNLEEHRFGDVNPLSVEELFARYALESFSS